MEVNRRKQNCAGRKRRGKKGGSRGRRKEAEILRGEMG